MKSAAIAFCFFLLSILSYGQDSLNSSKKLTLPNGWSLTPAGQGYLLGDLPLNMSVSNSKKFLAVTNNGQSIQSIQLIDTKSGSILDNIEVAKCWVGLIFE